MDANPHVHDFVDMHHLGDCLLKLGFIDPVLDIERVTMEYESVCTLLKDLRQLGVVNQHGERRRGLTGRRMYQAFVKSYEDMRTSSGALPSSWEIIFGQAMASEHDLGVSIQVNQTK